MGPVETRSWAGVLGAVPCALRFLRQIKLTGEFSVAGAAECGQWNSIAATWRVFWPKRHNQGSCRIVWPLGSVCLSSVSW